MRPQFLMQIRKLQENRQKKLWASINGKPTYYMLISEDKAFIWNATSVSLNELKFLYLSTKLSLLLNLTGSRKWSNALQKKISETKEKWRIKKD